MVSGWWLETSNDHSPETRESLSTRHYPLTTIHCSYENCRGHGKL